MKINFSLFSEELFFEVHVYWLSPPGSLPGNQSQFLNDPTQHSRLYLCCQCLSFCLMIIPKYGKLSRS